MTAMLIDHLWQSTVFALLAALVALALRHHSARLRYWVWFAASVKFFVPFAALAALGGSFGWERAATADYGWGYRFAEPMTTFATGGSDGTTLEVALLATWIGGSGVVLGVWLARWLRLRSAVRGTRTLRLAGLVGSSIEVRETAAIGPGVVGFFRPVLVVPKGIVESVAPRHLGPVLQHEVCHLRRQDNLTALIHMIVEVAFWFHPLVWLIGGRMVAERERACDEFVVAAGTAPEAYAEGIIEVCRFHVDAGLPCAAGIGSSKLRARIEAIVENRRLRQLSRPGFALLAASVVAAVAAPVLVGAFGIPPVAAQPAPPVEAQSPILNEDTATLPGPAPATPPPPPAAREELPLVRIPPDYPPEALRGGVEGWVRLQFTITATGSVRDPVVIASNPPGVFDAAALRAILRWRFNPRIVNGAAVERSGAQTEIRFELRDDPPARP
jgi:TonB family protein